MSWKETGALLRAKGWTIQYLPLDGFPPYVWRSPDGLSGSDYRSYHPTIPPDAVMQYACRRGDVEFTHLTAPGVTP
jgi:hypothetical protein